MHTAFFSFVAVYLVLQLVQMSVLALIDLVVPGGKEADGETI